MTGYRTVKIMIDGNGGVHPAPLTAIGGYRKTNPIVEIVEVPTEVSTDVVLRTYSRCILLPVMHADRPVPWHKISGAKQGQIIRLGPGRPHLNKAEKFIRLNITLSPEAVAMLDGLGDIRSQTIERLIRAAVDPTLKSE